MTSFSIDDIILLRLLLSIDGVGPVKIRNLLARFSNIHDIFSSDFAYLTSIDGIQPKIAKSILNVKQTSSSIRNDIERELLELEKIRAKIITIWDSEYPPILKKIYDPPIILYYLGELKPEDDFAISIVGTRRVSNYGKAQADMFAKELVRKGYTIVSGMARGTDTIAHNAALDAGGRTIAVLGSGLGNMYPPENKRLADRIADNGAVITEYDFFTKPDAVNFPRRNRIISGLSLGVVVVESGAKGGALRTASFALDQDREVFAVPGNLSSFQSEGTNALIRKGEAKLLQKVDDILEEVRVPENPEDLRSQRIIPDLNMFEEKIVSCLSKEPIQIDLISRKSGLSASECQSNLLTLEFKGIVKQLPGKMFVLV